MLNPQDILEVSVSLRTILLWFLRNILKSCNPLRRIPLRKCLRRQNCNNIYTKCSDERISQGSYQRGCWITVSRMTIPKYECKENGRGRADPILPRNSTQTEHPCYLIRGYTFCSFCPRFNEKGNSVIIWKQRSCTP